MPIFKIHHITKYTYDSSVRESINEIKIFPYQSFGQEVLQHELLITGDPDVQTYFDYWKNKAGAFTLVSAHNELVIESKMMVRTTVPPVVQVNVDAGFHELKREMEEQLQMLELASADAIVAQNEIEQITNRIFREGKSVAAVVEECCHYIFQHFSYIKGVTTVETTVDEILEHRAGVCQDFAHLMLQVLRTLHIPSRYVSGYICPNKNGMRGEGATHAWVEAWIPEYGWAGIDPTNDVWVTNTHVKLAVGRHFNDCTPVKGTFKGAANQKLSVFVSVSYEDGHTFEEVNNVPVQPLHNEAELARQRRIASQQ